MAFMKSTNQRFTSPFKNVSALALSNTPSVGVVTGDVKRGRVVSFGDSVEEWLSACQVDSHVYRGVALAPVVGLFRGESVYGKTDLVSYLSSKVCCAIHQSVCEVLGRSSSIEKDLLGTHPSIRAGQMGMPKLCSAEIGTLIRDRQFCQMALSFSEPGFQFRSDRILSSMRKYETGTVLGVSAFGQGYCYLRLFREQYRFRVARILGPVPLVSDVLVMYRLAGNYRHAVNIRCIELDMFHVESDGLYSSGAEMFSELLGLVEMNPNARIGTDVVPKVFCNRCNCTVKAAGHEARCRVPRVKDPVGELVGDALHAMDVKMVLVSLLPRNSHYTVESQNYISASSQRRYLEAVDPLACVEGRSDHSWGSEFEIRYRGKFRYLYLKFLIETVINSHGLNVKAAPESICLGVDVPLDHVSWVRYISRVFDFSRKV